MEIPDWTCWLIEPGRSWWSILEEPGILLKKSLKILLTSTSYSFILSAIIVILTIIIVLSWVMVALAYKRIFISPLFFLFVIWFNHIIIIKWYIFSYFFYRFLEAKVRIIDINVYWTPKVWKKLQYTMVHYGLRKNQISYCREVKISVNTN